MYKLMRNIAFICFLVGSINVLAQPAGFKKLEDVKTFKTAVARNHNSINDITADFKQVKHLSLLEDKIQSKGKFYFKKEDKVRIEYTNPYSYLVVMNGTRMLVKDEQKTNKINAGNSKMMQSVNRIMVDCMRGTVLDNPDFKVTAYHNAKQYMLTMIPTSPDMKKLFQQIDVHMNKVSLDVEKLVMKEQGGDYTDMEFFNTSHNTSLNETLFKVR